MRKNEKQKCRTKDSNLSGNDWGNLIGLIYNDHFAM